VALKFRDELTWKLKILTFKSQVLDEDHPVRYQGVPAKVACEATLYVVLLVLVIAETRAFGVLVSQGRLSLATRVPVQVGPEGRRRQKNFDGGVVVASKRLVRIVNLNKMILYSNACLRGPAYLPDACTLG